MKPEKPALLVIGYADWPSPRKSADVFTRMQAIAASELLRQKKVEQLVLATGSAVRGEPPVAIAIEECIKTDLPRTSKEVPIVVAPVRETTTAEEVRQFHRIAQEQNWDNVAVLTIKEHAQRVERSVKRTFKGRPTPTILIAEEVLTTSSPPPHAPNRYRALVHRTQSSPQMEAFRKREAMINPIDRLSVGSPLLRFVNKLMRDKTVEILVFKFLSKLAKRT